MEVEVCEEKPRVASVPVGVILKNTPTDITDRIGQQDIPFVANVRKYNPREIEWKYLSVELEELKSMVANMEYQ